MKQKQGRIQSISLFWLILSLLYLFFALSLEDRRMPGDRGGWDPGSSAMPMGIGVIMTVISTYLVIKDRMVIRKKREAPAAVSETALEEPKIAKAAGTASPVRADRLILLTCIITVAYILLFRRVGFIVSTTAMMSVLTFFYLKQDVRFSYVKSCMIWSGVSIGTGAGLYTLGLILILNMRHFGRVWGIELMRNRLVSVIPAVAVWAVILYLISRTITKFIHPKTLSEGARAMLLSVMTTLFLYLVFMQMFRVALPAGILY